MNSPTFYLNNNYLFDLRPTPLGPAGKILLPVAVLAALAIGVWLRARAKKSSDTILRASLVRLSQPLLVMGSMGVLYAFFAYQAIPLLSMRAILFGGVLATAVWISLVGRKEMQGLPQKRAERERRRQLEKYLPK